MKNSKKNNDKIKKVGTNLGLLLKHYSVSFRKLGSTVGLAHTYLFRLSKGQHDSPGFRTFEKIANFFNISLAQLTGDEEIDFKSLPKNLDLSEK